MAIDLGDAIVKVKADTTAMMKTLKATKKQVGQMMMLTGAAVVAGLGMAAKSAATFEQAITNAASVTGKTGEEFEIARGKMEELAKTLGRTTVFSAKEAAEAMYDLSSKGFDVAAMSVEELQPILDLAAATQHDLTATTEVTTATLRGFGLENEELTRIADVMTKAIGSSAANMDKLGVSMPVVSSTAKTLSVSLEETVAMLSALYDRGIDASTSATSLRNIMMELNAKTPRITKGFANVGISLDGIDVKTQGVIGAFKKLRERGLTAEQALAIFGKRTGNVASALVSATDEAGELTKELMRAAGTAGEIAALQLNTLAGQAKLLKSAFEAVVLNVGKALIPALTSLATHMAKVFSRMAAWTEAHPALTKAIVALTAAIGLGVLGAGLILACTKLQIAIRAVGMAMAWLTAHPIVALITIIAGALTFAITQIIKHWDDFKWAIEEVGRVVVDIFERMKTAVNDFFTGAAEHTLDFLLGPWRIFREQILAAGGRSWFIDAMGNMQQASGIAFSSIATDIQATISQMYFLRRVLAEGMGGDVQRQMLAGANLRMGQSAGWIRTMIGLGEIDPAEIRAEIAAAERQREIGAATGMDVQMLTQIQNLITYLTTLLTAEQRGVTVNVENMTLENEDQATVMAERIYNITANTFSQGGTQLGFT